MPIARADVAAAVFSAALVGCGDSNAPLGSGSHLKADVDASPELAQSGDDAGALPADSPFAPLDGQYGALSDAYVGLAVCAQCACAAGTYCYGGSPYSSFSGVCDQTASTSQEIGCHSIPVACANGPDCVCLLSLLPVSASCYPVCAKTGAAAVTVYCPP